MPKKSSIDTEALKKNQFWIVLGLFAVLWLVAFIMVKASANDEKKKAWEKAKNEIETAKKQGPKTEAFQKPWQEYGKKFRDHKDVIWKDAWDQQAAMYTWPDSMPLNARPLYLDDPFARTPTGEKDETTDLNNRNAFRTVWYPEQFAGLDQIVYPVEFNGGFGAVFPVQTWDQSAAPTGEEIWLAQEDFWVRREMLFMIREALDQTALFREVPPDPKAKAEKLPEGIVAKKVFRNSSWELTLLIKKARTSNVLVISEDSRIKNINPAERTLVLASPKSKRGLPFRLLQDRAVAQLDISGEPLPYGKDMPFKKEFSVSPVNLARPFLVEQVLEWEISPIRRIDALELAMHSHRTATIKLKINEELKKIYPEPVDETAPAGGGAEAMGGSPMGGGGGAPAPTGGPGSERFGGPGAGMARGEVTRINQIPRERYLHVTPQCRHLPVALRLIVDQANIQDVLTAVANSRLRIQITQVTLHHARDAHRSSPQNPGMGPFGSGGPPPAGSVGSGSAMPPRMPPMGGSRLGGMAGFPGARPLMPMMMGGSRGGGDEGNFDGPGPMGGGIGSEGAGGFQDNARLVELCVYGIASLYERFPPREKKADTPAPATP